MKKAFVLVGLVGLVGCGNQYTVTSTYRNRADDAAVYGEYRTVTAKVEGRATIVKVGEVFKKMLSFVNDEVMYKRADK